MAKPPRVSISGEVAAVIDPMRLDRPRTYSTESLVRLVMIGSRFNALTTRTPCAVSWVAAMMPVMPSSSPLEAFRMRFTSKRTPITAIGPMTRTMNDMPGLWMTMTVTSPTSERISRPNVVITVLSVLPGELARCVIAAMRSLDGVRSK